jgi:hypothetical protein
MQDRSHTTHRKAPMTDEHTHGHDKEPAETESHVDVPLNVAFEFSPDAPKDATLAAHVFDENGDPVCHCALGSDRNTLHLPRSAAGRMVTIAIAAQRNAGANPSLAAIEARGAHVVRTLVPADLKAVDAGRLLIPGRWFKRSCCRVRGRVIRRIRLANGKTIERPLCIWRTICCFASHTT